MEIHIQFYQINYHVNFTYEIYWITYLFVDLFHFVFYAFYTAE